MRVLVLGAFFFITTITAGSAGAADVVSACNVCACASGEFACGDAFTEDLEEQGLCASLCAAIGSSGTSGPQFIDTPCSELPQCGNVGAPAAGPLWLSIGVVGLLGFGGWTIKRARSRRTA
jgi:hypothetical protein